MVNSDWVQLPLPNSSPSGRGSEGGRTNKTLVAVLQTSYKSDNVICHSIMDSPMHRGYLLALRPSCFNAIQHDSSRGRGLAAWTRLGYLHPVCTTFEFTNNSRISCWLSKYWNERSYQYSITTVIATPTVEVLARVALFTSLVWGLAWGLACENSFHGVIVMLVGGDRVECILQHTIGIAAAHSYMYTHTGMS